MTRIHQAPSGAVHITSPKSERTFYNVSTRVYEKNPDPEIGEDLITFEALGADGRQLRATTSTLHDAISTAWCQRNRLRRGGVR